MNIAFGQQEASRRLPDVGGCGGFRREVIQDGLPEQALGKDGRDRVDNHQDCPEGEL